MNGSATFTITENHQDIKFTRNIKTKSRLVILSTVLAVLFFITTVIFVIFFAFYFIKNNEKVSTTEEVCITRECVNSAARMMAHMNLSVDPCEDFGEYACGRFNRETVLEPDQLFSVPQSVIFAENSKVSEDIIIEPIKQGEALYMTNWKRFYKSCLDEAKAEEIGFKPYLTDPLATDWPTLNKNWTEKIFNLSDVMARYGKVDIYPLFSHSVIPDFSNSSRNILLIDIPAFDEISEFHNEPRDSRYLMAYQKYLADTAFELGASRSVADKDAKEVLDLEYALLIIDFPQLAATPQPPTMEATTLKGISIAYPDLDINSAVKAAFSTVNISLSDDEDIINNNKEYIENASRIINEYTPRTVQNLFGFKYAISKVKDLTKRMRNITLNMETITTGWTSKNARTSECRGMVSKVFWFGISKEFVKRKFSQGPKIYVEAIVDNLIKTFRQIIEESTWIGKTTKQEVFKKLSAIKRKIGYPTTGFEDSDLEARYKQYVMSEDNFYQNRQLLSKLTTMEKLVALRKPNDKDEWVYSPTEVNAFYNYKRTEIVIPAGYLQPPFFSMYLQDCINYGGIGVVAAHELTHAFDYLGAIYDSESNIRSWWQKPDWENFTNRSKCIVDQYSRFYVEEVKKYLNGYFIRGETVADNGGLKVSFRAYKEFVRKKGEQPKLPGLNMTQDQLFFLSFAQAFCMRMPPKTFATYMEKDPHVTGKYRIIGPLQNFEDFSKTFNCPRGSYMNPEKKCSVW